MSNSTIHEPASQQPSLIERLGQLLIFSNLYVAFPVTCLAWTTYLMWELPADPAMLGFVYCATLFLYSLHRLAGLWLMPQAKWSVRHLWAARHKPFMIAITTLSGGLAAVLFWHLWGQTHTSAFVAILVPAAVISLGYALPVLPWKGKWLRLRDVPLIKIVLIALVVDIITLYLPLSAHWWVGFDFYIGLPYWIIYSLQRFFFLLAITIPFDVRDAAADAATELKTLPTLLGSKRALGLAKRFALVAAVLAVLPYIAVPMRDTLIPMLALLPGALLAWLVIKATHTQRSEYFFALLVEGTMVMQWLVYVVVASLS